MYVSIPLQYVFSFSRETSLLLHPQHSTAINKQRVANVIAHEVAHLWFGNIVTCDWWSVSWLNEGFARYYQYMLNHWVMNENIITGNYLILLSLQVEPTWELDLQFVVEQVQDVFQLDSLLVTRAMTREVNTPVEVSGNFDPISYSKGACLVRMMEHIVGNSGFVAALQDYLRVR
jgi:aminopeptidase N